MAGVEVVELLPRSPRLDRAGDAFSHGRRSCRVGSSVLGRSPTQRKAHPLAGLHSEAGAHRRAVHRHRHARGHRQAVGTAERSTAVLGGAEQRPDQSVLGSRGELNVHLDAPGQPLHQTKQLVGWVDAEVMAALTIGGRQDVDEADASRLGGHARLDRQGSAEVLALRRERCRRSDRPVSRAGVEDAREDGRAVEPRQAEPVNRSAAAHQRGRGAIGEQAVVGDRQAVDRVRPRGRAANGHGQPHHPPGLGTVSCQQFAGQRPFPS